MKATILFFFSAIFLIQANAFELRLPAKFKYKKSLENDCIVIALPKLIAGSRLCEYKGSMQAAAIESRLFEDNDARWYLVGPGIPNRAKINIEKNSTSLKGIIFCPTKDKQGSHAAGGNCFVGFASNEKISFTFQSQSISLININLSSFHEHETIFQKLVALNF